MQMRFIGNGNLATPDPPLRRVRVRQVAVGDTGTPHRAYVYAEGATQTSAAETWISVFWDEGGLSRVRNDAGVTWLE